MFLGRTLLYVLCVAWLLGHKYYIPCTYTPLKKGVRHSPTFPYGTVTVALELLLPWSLFVFINQGSSFLFFFSLHFLLSFFPSFCQLLYNLQSKLTTRHEFELIWIPLPPLPFSGVRFWSDDSHVTLGCYVKKGVPKINTKLSVSNTVFLGKGNHQNQNFRICSVK